MADEVETQEGSANGVALPAAAGMGQFASVEEACQVAIRETETLLPVARESPLFARDYEVYRQLYPTIRPLFGLMHGVILRAYQQLPPRHYRLEPAPWRPEHPLPTASEDLAWHTVPSRGTEGRQDGELAVT